MLTVSCRIENVIEFLLQQSSLLQWPAAILLVAKYHILQYGSRDTKQLGNMLVQIGTLLTQRYTFTGIVYSSNNTVKLLKFHFGTFPSNIQ